MIKIPNPLTAAQGLTPVREGGATGKVGYFGLTRLEDDGVTPKMHKGVDLLAVVGQPVYAAHAGTVVRSGWEDPNDPYFGYGLRVTINGDGFIQTRYAHLSKIYVHVGEGVEQNQMIGLSGRTGNAHGLPEEEAHVHFELRKADVPMDPLEAIA